MNDDTRMNEGNSPLIPEPSAAERAVIAAAAARREACLCGQAHDGAVTCAVSARMIAYLAAHPGQQFVYDDDPEDVVGVLKVHDPGPPEILAAAATLPELLDIIGAPPAPGMS